MANVTDRIIAVGDIARKPLLVISEARTAPTVGILDAPLRCIVLNEEWFKHVGGAIEVLTEWRAWNDDMDERSDSVQEILKILSGEYCMFQLRQNPNNPCLMEQSLDNGVTWTTAMDYSQCVSPALASQALNDSIDALTALLLAYDTTVTSIAPDMVYDATATDDIRDLALCHALSEVVDLMCELELEYRRQIALVSNITAVMLALLGVAVTIMTGGTATPLYLAVSATLAGGFGTIFGGLSTLILNDETAKDAVVCCMRDALAGATITKLDFEQSLDACGFTGGTNESQLAGAISELLAQDDVYESFVDYMQRAYRFAELGIALCPCIAPTWIQNYLSGNGDPSIDGWVYNQGTYDNVGLEIDSTWNGSFTHSSIPNWTFAGTTTITKAKHTGNLNKGTNDHAQIVQMWDDSASLWITLATVTPGGSGTVAYSVEFIGSQVFDINDRLRLFASVFSNTNIQHSAHEKTMLIEGEGINPFV